MRFNIKEYPRRGSKIQAIKYFEYCLHLRDILRVYLPLLDDIKRNYLTYIKMRSRVNKMILFRRTYHAMDTYYDAKTHHVKTSLYCGDCINNEENKEKANN